VDEVLNTALPVERRADAHPCSKHYVSLTEITGDEADVLMLLARGVRYSGQIQPPVLRLDRYVGVVLLEPIGTMPDPAVYFLLIETVGQNRAGEDWDRVNQRHVTVCALGGRCDQPRE
jgi:hypothetical protein